MVIPIRIAINTNLGESAYDVVDMITWIIYLIDIFVNCRTTYLDNFGIEEYGTRKILKHYLLSFRFAMDFLSLLNFPTLIWPNPPLFFNLLGLLKTLRFLRAQDLIRQSRLKKSEKASMSCGYFFILLLIYLHIMACIFFTICLQTYKESTDRLDILQKMNLYTCKDDKDDECVKFDRFAGDYHQTRHSVLAIFDDGKPLDWENGRRINAWLPPYDNYDGSELFWRHYELSLLNQNELDALLEDEIAEVKVTEEETQSCEWCYIWSVCIYYSVLVIGGNEM